MTVEGRKQRRDCIALQLHARIEEDHHSARGRLYACIHRGRETQGRVERDHAQAFGGTAGQPACDPRVAGVVDHDRFEIRLAVSEDREQPPLGVREPAVDDGEQGYRAWYGRRRRAGRGFDRMQLAARGAVHDVPTAGPEPLADGISGFEVPFPPALHTLGDQA